MKHDIIISKMIAYIQIINQYCVGMSHDDFLSNRMVVDACVFNLSQIGELAGKIDDGFRTEHSDIPWGQIKGLRNRIVHDYEGVNRELIWEIIGTDIPKLLDDLMRISSEKDEQ